MDRYKNFARATLAAGIDVGATSLTVASGEATQLYDPPFTPCNGTIWNKSNYASPTGDPEHEIVRLLDVAGDTFTIAKGKEGTTDRAHNTPGKVYGIEVTVTAKTLTDITTVYPNGAPFWNAKVVNVHSVSVASGDVDLYTVPVGRRAILLTAAVSQSAAPTISVYFKLKLGGTYYRASSTTVVTNGATSNIRGLQIPGNGGDAFAMNSGSSGASVWLKILEFDGISPVAFSIAATFINGDNTLYQCPANKSAIPLTGLDLSGATSTAVGTIQYAHDTGAGRTLKCNVVPSGGSVAPGNAIVPSQTAANAALTAVQATFCLSPGDFVSLNVDSSSAAQLAWMIVFELPLPV